jgi:hypothetical protein
MDRDDFDVRKLLILLIAKMCERQELKRASETEK